MRTKALLIGVLTVALSGCVTLYSTDRHWKLPGVWGNYVLSAKMTMDLFTWEAAVSVNGREVLTGQSYFWSHVITMNSTIAQLPVVAVCDKDAKQCDVSIAGVHAALLNL